MEFAVSLMRYIRVRIVDLDCSAEKAQRFDPEGAWRSRMEMPEAARIKGKLTEASAWSPN